MASHRGGDGRFFFVPSLVYPMSTLFTNRFELFYCIMLPFASSILAMIICVTDDGGGERDGNKDVAGMLRW